MTINADVWKRTMKRLAELETCVENLHYVQETLVDAIRLLSMRPGSAGGPDPFDVVLTGPNHRGPTPLPPEVVARYDSGGWHSIALNMARAQLSEEELAEFDRRTRAHHRLREMREEREARKKISVCGQTTGGRSPRGQSITERGPQI